jgi:hypothetical protein
MLLTAGICFLILVGNTASTAQAQLPGELSQAQITFLKNRLQDKYKEIGWEVLRVEQSMIPLILVFISVTQSCPI